MIDLLARNPAPDPAALTAELAPSARFEDVRFETYRPNADYPSQAEARASLGSFVGAAQNKPSGLRLFRRRRPEGKGLYLTAASAWARRTCWPARTTPRTAPARS